MPRCTGRRSLPAGAVAGIENHIEQYALGQSGEQIVQLVVDD
ncbi:hypothetical protein [Cryobacterium serini]|nr:hypothetical protein [Cryobacterium serini]